MAGLSDPLRYKQYWNNFSGERNNPEIQTYDTVMAEYAGIKGIPIEFYTLNIDHYKENMDALWGENTKSTWDRCFTLTAILDEWSQDTLEWQQGVQWQTDQIILYIHRSTFDSIVGKRSNVDPRGQRVENSGPVEKDMLKVIPTGLVYEVITAGLHFLSPQDQHFGHKFWYKLTCQIREVSHATVGVGEQYGNTQQQNLEEIYTQNLQCLVPTPNLETEEEICVAEPTYDSCNGYSTIAGCQTQPVTGMPNICPNYETVGTDGSPIQNTNDMCTVEPPKQNSTHGQNEQIESAAHDDIYNPKTLEITEPESEDNIKYGPHGSVIPNKRDLWGDW